jgi:hypothetical protein
MKKIFQFLPSTTHLRKRSKRKNNNNEYLKMFQQNKKRKYRKKQKGLRQPSEKVKNHKHNILKRNKLTQISKLRIKDGLVYFKECKKYTTQSLDKRSA